MNDEVNVGSVPGVLGGARPVDEGSAPSSKENEATSRVGKSIFGGKAKVASVTAHAPRKLPSVESQKVVLPQNSTLKEVPKAQISSAQLKKTQTPPRLPPRPLPRPAKEMQPAEQKHKIPLGSPPHPPIKATNITQPKIPHMLPSSPPPAPPKKNIRTAEKVGAVEKELVTPKAEGDEKKVEQAHVFKRSIFSREGLKLGVEWIKSKFQPTVPERVLDIQGFARGHYAFKRLQDEKERAKSKISEKEEKVLVSRFMKEAEGKNLFSLLMDEELRNEHDKRPEGFEKVLKTAMDTVLREEKTKSLKTAKEKFSNLIADQFMRIEYASKNYFIAQAEEYLLKVRDFK